MRDLGNGNMGSRIRAKRLERQLTQKQLAEQLGVTDKAVSKWETGNSLPDILQLLPLAAALGISAAELLGGPPEELPPPERAVVDTLAYSCQWSLQRRKKIQFWIFVGLSGSFLLAALICWICDISTAGALSWSRIVDLSLGLLWLTILPLFTLRQRPVVWALTVLSILILPWLYLLGAALGDARVFQFGLPIAPAVVLFLWGVYAIFRKLYQKKWLAVSAGFLLAALLEGFIHFIVERLLMEPVQFGSGIFLLLAALLCFLVWKGTDTKF